MTSYGLLEPHENVQYAIWLFVTCCIPYILLKAINVDVIRRVTECRITEEVRKEENLPTDTRYVATKYRHPTFSGRGPQLLLWPGLLVAHIKITSSIPMHLNYCILFCNVCINYEYSLVLCDL
jgi:hypothetical protein